MRPIIVRGRICLAPTLGYSGCIFLVACWMILYLRPLACVFFGQLVQRSECGSKLGPCLLLAVSDLSKPFTVMPLPLGGVDKVHSFSESTPFRHSCCTIERDSTGDTREVFKERCTCGITKSENRSRLEATVAESRRVRVATLKCICEKGRRLSAS